MKNVIVNMIDTKTGNDVQRTISATNVYSSSTKGFELGSKEDQKKNLNEWIRNRANEQHETTLMLVDWEIK